MLNIKSFRTGTSAMMKRLLACSRGGVAFVSEQTGTAGKQEAARYQSNGSCKYSYCVRERYVGDREW